jgi:hypothetical protein
VLLLCVATLVLMTAAGVEAQSPETEVQILTNIRTQMQDLLVLKWSQLAVDLVGVGLLAAILGAQR